MAKQESAAPVRPWGWPSSQRMADTTMMMDDEIRASEARIRRSYKSFPYLVV